MAADVVAGSIPAPTYTHVRRTRDKGGVAPVEGFGPGSVLSGRYTASSLLAAATDGPHERWLAQDGALGREVVVVAFPTSADVAAPALDAARRACGVEDPRLVRILDVGSDSGTSFIVEEPLSGAKSIGELITQGSGALPANEVRRLIGESSRALDAARQRGLHHLALSPESVLRLPDGSVKVRGLSTEAVLADADRAYDEAASRIDAVGLVKLIYAGLTGRWPVAVSEGGRAVGAGTLAMAPAIVGGVPQPAELAVGVPADLDGICRLTLNRDEGPVGPGDLANQIAPWPESIVTEAPAAAPAPTGALLADESDFGRGAYGVEPTAVMPTVPGTAAAGSALAGAGAVGGIDSTDGMGDFSDSSDVDEHRAARAAGVGSFARAAVDRASTRAAERRAARGDEVAGYDEYGEPVDMDTAFTQSEQVAAEPPLPLFGQGADTPGKAQSRIALAIVGALVLAALYVGIQNVLKIGQPSGGPNRPVSTATPTAPASTGGSATTPPPTTPAGSGTPTTVPAAGPAKFLSAVLFNPGGGVENGNKAGLVIDGDQGTKWESRWYGTANYNGSRAGVGVLLDLGSPRTLTEVSVVLPVNQQVTVYGTSGDSLDGATEYGKLSASGTVKVPAGAPAASKVIVFVTSAGPAEAAGRFRAQIAEVTAK